MACRYNEKCKGYEPTNKTCKTRNGGDGYCGLFRIFAEGREPKFQKEKSKKLENIEVSY